MGERPGASSHVSRVKLDRWARAGEAERSLGLPPPGQPSSRSSRRVVVVRVAPAGVPQDQIGHASTVLTAHAYTHCSPPPTAGAAEATADLVLRLSATRTPLSTVPERGGSWVRVLTVRELTDSGADAIGTRTLG